MRLTNNMIKHTNGKLKSYYKEYCEENNSSISCKDWFIKVLQYSEKDLANFGRTVKKQEKKKHEKKKPNREIKTIDPHLPAYIGNREHPEYNKYFSIVCEQRKYNMEHPGASISLKNYLISTYNFSEEEAKIECKKIEHILYCKNKK